MSAMRDFPRMVNPRSDSHLKPSSQMCNQVHASFEAMKVKIVGTVGLLLTC
jgi:hypothetical protein